MLALIATETRFSAQPIARASSRIETSRARTFPHERGGAATLACVSDMVSVEQEHVFESARHASRIF